MKLRHFVVAASVICAASLAWAEIIPIPEFTGYSSEGFEDVLSPGGHTSPVDILRGRCSMDDDLAHTVVIAYNWMGPAGTVYPQHGLLMGGTVAGNTVFHFTSPVTDFGAFMTTVSPSPDGTVSFSDEFGGPIGSLPLSVQPGAWGWQGWHSDTPIGGIVMTGTAGPGFGLIFDQMQANWVPEPASLGLLAVAGVLLVRRR